MPRRSLVALSMSMLLLQVACDPQKIAELEEGVSTEADVRARFGEPAAVYDEPNGDRTFEYPRQPAGQTNYMVSIGADGKMTALRQVLKPATFTRVTPGMDRDQVRRLLGRPASAQAYALKEEEVWEWRYADGQEVKIFSVTFDRDGRVVLTGTTLDPKEAGQLGR
ncbi:MAG: outer membrane protein assembly factor BamE [Pseudomonadota bacterium]|nr:outer membrane protein assembly factor BamE [Pseudomonadota bacterium]